MDPAFQSSFPLFRAAESGFCPDILRPRQSKRPAYRQKNRRPFLQRTCGLTFSVAPEKKQKAGEHPSLLSGLCEVTYSLLAFIFAKHSLQ